MHLRVVLGVGKGVLLLKGIDTGVPVLSKTTLISVCTGKQDCIVVYYNTDVRYIILFV